MTQYPERTSRRKTFQALIILTALVSMVLFSGMTFLWGWFIWEIPPSLERNIGFVFVAGLIAANFAWYYKLYQQFRNPPLDPIPLTIVTGDQNIRFRPDALFFDDKTETWMISGFNYSTRELGRFALKDVALDQL